MMQRFGVAAATVALLFSLTAAPGAAQSAASAPSLVVVGGTPAGVVAAVAAARNGLDVTLVAKGDDLGGILSDAMMDQWDLNVAPDGDEIQAGIFREIYAALGDVFTPQAAAAEFASLVAAEPRIHVIYNAQAIGVTTVPLDGEQRVTSVRFRNADGHTFALAATNVIDATDDGDVAALAGAHFDVGRQDTGIDEKTQSVTLMFTVDGVDWAQLASAYDEARDGAGGVLGPRAWGYSTLMDAYRAHEPGVIVRDLNLGREPDGTVTVNAIDVLGIDGLDDGQRATARALTQAEAPHLIDYLRTRLPGFEDATVGRFAGQLYVRETRHFAGHERLTESNVWNGTIPSDTIGLSSYPLDLHPVTATDEPAYAPDRHVYGVPFGTMVPLGFTNLLLASPSISATHVASGSARVIPTTIEEGEAAGDAAALASRLGISFARMAGDAMAVADLRQILRRDGAIVDYAAPHTTVATSGAKAKRGRTVS
jgi:hypothetical protein